MIKRHPEWGADVAARALLSPAIGNIIRHHHERFDGMGYPDGLAGQRIPLEARIVAVADIFDALTTDRPYRPAFSREKAASILREMTPSQLDPNLTELFLGTVAVVPAEDGQGPGERR